MVDLLEEDESYEFSILRPNLRSYSMLTNSILSRQESRTSSDTGKSMSPKPSVQFGRVTIRQYNSILDANPACSSGAAISIGWDYQEFQAIDIESYESTRLRREKGVGRLSGKRRAKILLRLGYSEEEIGQAVRSISKARSQRDQSTKNSGFNKFDDTIQSAARRFKSLFSRSSARDAEKVTYMSHAA